MYNVLVCIGKDEVRAFFLISRSPASIPNRLPRKKGMANGAVFLGVKRPLKYK